MIGEPSETRSWLCQLREGQTEVLAELFEHYRSRLERMVQLRLDTRLVGRVDPSDVLQEAYLDAADRIQDYLRKPAVTSYIWLRGLTKERLIRLYRRHLGAKCRTVKRECALPEASSILLAKRLLAAGTSPSKALRRKELSGRVRGALDKLATDDRDIILMRHFEDMSNGEVSQALGLSDSAASMRYGRAVFRLKQLLMADLTTGGSK
jgi:RNA polymerase sigma-70 factor (ECF subfamily)